MDALGAKRDQVWREIEAMREDLDSLQARVAAKEAQLRHLDELLVIENQGRHASISTHTGSFLDKAIAIVGDSAHGVHYREILAALNTEGVHVPGKDPAANLIAHMSRDDRFVRTGRGTYGLDGTHSRVARGKTKATRRSRTRKSRVRSRRST